MRQRAQNGEISAALVVFWPDLNWRLTAGREGPGGGRASRRQAEASGSLARTSWAEFWGSYTKDPPVLFSRKKNRRTEGNIPSARPGAAQAPSSSRRDWWVPSAPVPGAYDASLAGLLCTVQWKAHPVTSGASLVVLRLGSGVSLARKAGSVAC